MPAMNDLLTRLQESPPETEMELRTALRETGYDLIMQEPSSGEGEYASDEESDAPTVVETEEVPDDIKDMMSAMMPIAPPAKHDLSHKGRGKMRVKVAKFVLGGDSKGRDK